MCAGVLFAFYLLLAGIDLRFGKRSAPRPGCPQRLPHSPPPPPTASAADKGRDTSYRVPCRAAGSDEDEVFESYRQFQQLFGEDFVTLYDLDYKSFQLAMDILKEWRLDRYYASKSKLFDLSLQVSELPG